MVPLSPLRYPGGKQRLAGVLSRIIAMNGLQGGTYAEPYAGGAGAALSLLFGEHVDRVLINDADPRIYAFWSSVLDHTDRFLKLVGTAPLNVREWSRQRYIYQHPKRYSVLHVGFATFFLNRCNRSGIIASGGPIGGKKQKGPWKIDARFNRVELEHRIERISSYRDRIALSCVDGIEFLRRCVAPLDEASRPFCYLDPPYYAKGPDLYLNHYKAADHEQLATWLSQGAKFPWVMTYDDVHEVRKLYRGFTRVRFDLDYSARERRVQREVMIVKNSVVLPPRWKRGIPRDLISPEARPAG